MKQNKPRDFMWVGSKIFDLYSILGDPVKLISKDLLKFNDLTTHYDEPIRGCIITMPNVENLWFGQPLKFGRSEAIYDFIHNIMDNRDDPGFYNVGECDYLSSYLLACWCNRMRVYKLTKYFDLLVHDTSPYILKGVDWFNSEDRPFYASEDCNKVLGCHINLKDCILLAITKRKDGLTYSLSGWDFPYPIQDFISALCLFMET